MTARDARLLGLILAAKLAARELGPILMADASGVWDTLLPLVRPLGCRLVDLADAILLLKDPNLTPALTEDEWLDFGTFLRERVRVHRLG